MQKKDLVWNNINIRNIKVRVLYLGSGMIVSDESCERILDKFNTSKIEHLVIVPLMDSDPEESTLLDVRLY